MVPHGTGIQERVIEGYNVHIDGRMATISAEVPKAGSREINYRQSDVIYTNPVQLLGEMVFCLPFH